MKKKNFNTRSMIMISMLGALAAILMFLEISVPLVPPFVKFDFSDLPVLISGYLFGPILGSITAIIKIVIKLLFKPTSTAFVGELSNLLLCICFMAVASLYYRKHRDRKGAMISLIISTIVTSIFAIILNITIIFPLYVDLFHLPMDQIVEMAKSTNPLVKDSTTMFLFSLLPFNLLKYGIDSFITFMIYKKISIIIKKYIQ